MATKVEVKQNISKPPSWANEIVAIFLLGVTVLLFLCLVSYSQTDPSVITASSQKIQNWIGVLGANISAILISAIGWTAYLLPPLLILVAWRVFKSENLAI